MSSEITTFYARQFATGIQILPQRMGTLRVGVDVDTDVKEGDRKFYDQLDSADMVPVTNRHGQTNYVEVPHRRRMVTCSPYEWADLIDRVDRRRILNEPVNDYSKSASLAVGRQTDDIIVAAFFASASTGVTGSTSTAFPTSTHQIAVGGTGMTITKILQARGILEQNHNPEDQMDNKWFAAMGYLQRRDLLGTTEVTSIDFNTVKALAQGGVDQFCGFTFIKCEGLGVDGSNDRRCPFWRKSSMKLAIAEESRVFVDILPGNRHSTQIRLELDAGATRMDEKGVVECIANE